MKMHVFKQHSVLSKHAEGVQLVTKAIVARCKATALAQLKTKKLGENPNVELKRLHMTSRRVGEESCKHRRELQLKKRRKIDAKLGHHNEGRHRDDRRWREGVRQADDHYDDRLYRDDRRGDRYDKGDRGGGDAYREVEDYRDDRRWDRQGDDYRHVHSQGDRQGHGTRDVEDYRDYRRGHSQRDDYHYRDGEDRRYGEDRRDDSRGGRDGDDRSYHMEGDRRRTKPRARGHKKIRIEAEKDDVAPLDDAEKEAKRWDALAEDDMSDMGEGEGDGSKLIFVDEEEEGTKKTSEEQEEQEGNGSKANADAKEDDCTEKTSRNPTRASKSNVGEEDLLLSEEWMKSDDEQEKGKGDEKSANTNSKSGRRSPHAFKDPLEGLQGSTWNVLPLHTLSKFFESKDVAAAIRVDVASLTMSRAKEFQKAMKKLCNKSSVLSEAKKNDKITEEQMVIHTTCFSSCIVES